MRICEYIKDKAGILIGYLLFIAIMLIAFRAMRTPGELTVIFLVLTVLLLVTVILTDYIKRRHFYNSLYAHMEQLDQKYLIMDTLEEPGFYEGKLVYEALYEINKSMTEHVREYRQSVDDFKENAFQYFSESQSVSSFSVEEKEAVNRLRSEKYIREEWICNR